MLIGVVSDVHYPNAERFYKLHVFLRDTKPDILVVAGDMVDQASRDTVERFFSKLRRWYRGPVVAVAGNHEHWLSRAELRSGLTSIEKLRMLAELYGRYDAHLLDVDGPICFEELCLAGVVGWYDYSYARGLGFTWEHFENCNPWGCTLNELEACERGYACGCPSWFQDCLLVRLGMSAPEYAAYNARRLRDQLSKVGAGKKTIVVLHHSPRRDLLRYSGDRYQDFYLAYAGHEGLDNAIREHAHKVRLVVYGHLHEKTLDWIVERAGITYVNGYQYTVIDTAQLGRNRTPRL